MESSTAHLLNSFVVFQDIDECKEKPINCGVGKCRNGRGWFTCDCPKGYYYNGVTCVGMLSNVIH